ncbi:MAG: UDP-2,3-diacylglucosamine diphosphatase LpxI [Elusimicrobia bacterium]|nr:UDP-2,3-diacylglucosamine diphosphatase LpxI [Elusimicrobiota bacterium]
MTPAIGLIAGSGRFPVLFAEEAKRRGARVVAVALKGVTDLPALTPAVDSVECFALGQVSAPLSFLKKSGVTQVVMAGKVQHVSLFGGIIPDLRAVKILASLKDRRTDTILSAVAEEFKKEGLEVLSSATYLQHLIPAAGVLTKRKPSADEEADAALGWKAAKALAGMDVGQSVVVQGRAVVAVEGMEGTDACVRRAGQLVRSNGEAPRLVVVKVAKPRQDFRFDLPVLGLDTLKTLGEAGASALALEAGKTLIFDRDEFVRGADAQGLAVWAVDGGTP